MKRLARWICLSAVAALFSPGTARAQFGDPFLSEPKIKSPGGMPKKRLERLQVGASLALWDFAAFPVKGTQFERVDAAASPLITADYRLTTCLSIGGWWNPLHGNIGAIIPGEFEGKVAHFDASFWDLHATLRLPEKRTPGWSIQAGFSQLHYYVDVIPGLRMTGTRNFGISFSSLNVWVNKTQEVGRRRIRGVRYSISLFGSAGYYTSSQFDRAWNLVVGGALPLSPHLSFNSSVWFNNLSDTNTRVTLGLDGRF